MQHVGRALWRANFVGALRLLGQAAARLRFGVPDPVLCGASAVELYAGSLWPAVELEVLASETSPLIAELFAAGFRWTQRPQHRGRGLRHPELQIALDVIEDRGALGLAELSNVLALAVDLGLTGPADKDLVWLKVVGIEDLIAEQVAGWLTPRARSGEVATQIRVLTALAREGVGGSFRTGYLRRRLAWETNGEVAFEALLSRGGAEDEMAPRVMMLTQLRTLISAWRIKTGFSFDRQRSSAERGSCENQTKAIWYRNERGRRAGRSSIGLANVVPFDEALSVPPG